MRDLLLQERRHESFQPREWNASNRPQFATVFGRVLNSTSNGRRQVVRSQAASEAKAGARN
jgi:hypothetical protein